MENVRIESNGKIEITPSATSSKDDFDFLVGTWKIHNRKLNTRLNDCTEWTEFDATGKMRKILKGIGNIDDFVTTLDGKPFEGMTLRLFNPSTKLWTIYWADCNSGVMQVPVVGSFEKNIGKFYAKDTFNGKEILVMFLWDKTNPETPKWSQAFSTDEGKTWEWNWYMYFENVNQQGTKMSRDQNLKVIELRNYLLKPNTLNKFAKYFEAHFIESQNVLGGYTLGQFRIKNVDDRFFWIRGFTDMSSRVKFLNDFYINSQAWKEFGPGANDMMINSDNVYLLRPLNNNGNSQEQSEGIKGNFLKTDKGIIVVDFYICNSTLEKVINLFNSAYIPFLKTLDIHNITLWVSEMSENDFPRLPVFQDKNLLLTITTYKDENEYQIKQKQINSMTTELRNSMLGLITTQSHLILYPISNK
ncbi:MAG: hypothetical protein M1391_13565 [Bacteroidetes bacterium]|nr:hypothetical protein [Bacteroidota bacterium]